MKTATFIRNLQGFCGDARLYSVNPPLMDYDGSIGYEHVIVSASDVMGDPETYIFGATPEGLIADWGELPGSFKGVLNHDEALKNAGYTIET